MFTGLVEACGKFVRGVSAGKSVHLRISCGFSEYTLGESIAVNGVCLTVTSFGDGWFECDASPETMRRTNLGLLSAGDSVHLEHALRVGDRLGGHIVSGHVDAVGSIDRAKAADGSIAVTVRAPQTVTRLVVEKGSIAVDGVSLTVNRVDRDSFDFMLIPHSQAVLMPNFAAPGRTVNLECDIIGRYVEKLLACTQTQNNDISPAPRSVTMETLREAGFLG